MENRITNALQIIKKEFSRSSFLIVYVFNLNVWKLIIPELTKEDMPRV
ncbi:MAG: hypothetical protein P8L83_03260 [Flavobacteriaceae bacterium]|nr:hypothetical protein [Flavobacteriaceae bacterium]